MSNTIQTDNKKTVTRTTVKILPYIREYIEDDRQKNMRGLNDQVNYMLRDYMVMKGIDIPTTAK